MSIKKMIFVLSAVLLAGSFSGCGNITFQSNERPEDKVVRLDKLGESPKGRNHDYKPDDAVSVIQDDGVFKTEGQVSEICGKLIFAEESLKSSRKIWMPMERAYHIHGDEKTAPKGYRVGISGGRSTDYEWFPASQIFPAPWANNVNLKIGDTVYKNHFGDFKPEKGVITELPKTRSGSFAVKFDGYQQNESLNQKDIFSSIEQAKIENLSPGDIVYYDKMYWAMIIAKSDSKVIIRREGFPAEDIIVDISRIQILK